MIYTKKRAEKGKKEETPANGKLTLKRKGVEGGTATRGEQNKTKKAR